MYPNANTIIGGLMSQSTVANAEFYTPTTGRYFFVAKAGLATLAETQAVYGTSYPDGTPLFYTTVNLAIASCVANRGDVIIILASHTETLVAASGVLISVAGVSLFGLGSGTTTPTFTSTTAVSASFDITAANVNVQNLTFTCGIDAQTAMVNVTATDVHFNMCTFNTNSGTIGAILGLFFNTTADRFVVNACNFRGPATNSGTTTTAQVKYTASVDGLIQNSNFTGKMTQAILNIGTVLRGFIQNNNFVVATGTLAISVAAASTPAIFNNTMNVPSGTTPIIAAAGFVAGNKYSAAAGVTAGAAITF